MTDNTTEDLEQRLGALERKVDEMQLEQQWLRQTIVSVASRVGDLAERTQVILQRGEATEELCRDTLRAVREIAAKLDALGSAPAAPTLKLAARRVRKRA